MAQCAPKHSSVVQQWAATLGTRSVNRDFGEDFMGARMLWSTFDGATYQLLVEQAGLRIVRAQEETEMEFGVPITFLWVIARKAGTPD